MYLKNSVQISATLQQQFTVWRKILTGENIDELLSIRQHFPYQKFPLIIFSAVCMPDHFFVQRRWCRLYRDYGLLASESQKYTFTDLILYRMLGYHLNGNHTLRTVFCAYTILSAQ